MRESAAWRKLRQSLVVVPQLHFERMEVLTRAGIPDLNLCWHGVEVWAELKKIDRFPVRCRTRTTLGLRADQAHWMEKRRAAGGHCCVICYAVEPRLWIILPNGFYAIAKKELTIQGMLETGLSFKKFDFKEFWRFVI